MKKGYVICWERSGKSKNLIYRIYDPESEKVYPIKQEVIEQKGLATDFGINLDLNMAIGDSKEIAPKAACTRKDNKKNLTLVYKSEDNIGLVDIQGNVYIAKYSSITPEISARITGFNFIVDWNYCRPISDIKKEIKYLDIINMREISFIEYNGLGTEEEKTYNIKEEKEIDTSKTLSEEITSETTDREEETISEDEIDEKLVDETVKWCDGAVIKEWVKHSEIGNTITMSREVLEFIKIVQLRIVVCNSSAEKTLAICHVSIHENKHILALVKTDNYMNSIEIKKFSKYRDSNPSDSEMFEATLAAKRMW